MSSPNECLLLPSAHDNVPAPLVNRWPSFCTLTVSRGILGFCPDFSLTGCGAFSGLAVIPARYCAALVPAGT